MYTLGTHPPAYQAHTDTHAPNLSKSGKLNEKEQDGEEKLKTKVTKKKLSFKWKIIICYLFAQTVATLHFSSVSYCNIYRWKCIKTSDNNLFWFSYIFYCAAAGYLYTHRERESEKQNRFMLANAYHTHSQTNASDWIKLRIEWSPSLKVCASPCLYQFHK